MDNTPQNIESSEDNLRQFMYEDYIEPFRDIIAMNYAEPEEGKIVFRTVQSIPPCEDDHTPRSLRKDKDSGEVLAHQFSDEEVKLLSDKKKLKLVGSYALSVNSSQEAALNSCISTYQRLKQKGFSEAQLRAYAEERGRFVACFKLTKEVGVISEFDEKGHANLLTYENVNLEEYRVKEFKPIPIKYE